MNEKNVNKQESKIKKWWNENYDVALPYVAGVAAGVVVTATVAAIYIHQEKKILGMGVAAIILEPEALIKLQEAARTAIKRGA